LIIFFAAAATLIVAAFAAITLMPIADIALR